MTNRWQVYVGAAIIVVGVIFLVGTVFDIDPWAICFPVVLIVAGVLVLLHPQLFTAGRLKLLGSVRRRGTWQVADGEFYVGVGDVHLDMTSADIPEGETRIRVLIGVGSVDVRVPEGVGVSVSSIGFVTDAKALGQKQVSFFTPFEVTSDGYQTAEHKVHLETVNFVGDVKVRQLQPGGSARDVSEQPPSPDEIPME
jgi:predicted membrane protein